MMVRLVGKEATMKPGDLVEIECSHDNGGAQWSKGGPGVSTFDSPQRQRWFRDGTCGVVIGKTCPKAEKGDWHRQGLYEILIGGEVHTMFRRDLKVVSDDR